MAHSCLSFVDCFVLPILHRTRSDIKRPIEELFWDLGRQTSGGGQCRQTLFLTNHHPHQLVSYLPASTIKIAL